MSNPIFRFRLTHQFPEGYANFTNNGFDVSLSGWTQTAFPLSTGVVFQWELGGIARADGTGTGISDTAYIGQQGPTLTNGVWHPGKYIIDIVAKNTTDTSTATPPFQSILQVVASQDSSFIGQQSSINYTGTGTWDVVAISDAYTTRRITFELDDYWDYLFFAFTKVGPTSNYEVDLRLDSISLITFPRAQNISEPDGWREASLKLERHPEFHSLVESFEGDLIFYGNDGVDDGGVDFIKNAESQFGPDTNLSILIEASFNEGGSYESLFDGQLDLSEMEETWRNKMSIPIIRNDFWSKFIARKDTPSILDQQ